MVLPCRTARQSLKCAKMCNATLGNDYVAGSLFLLPLYELVFVSCFIMKFYISVYFSLAIMSIKKRELVLYSNSILALLKLYHFLCNSTTLDQASVSMMALT